MGSFLGRTAVEKAVSPQAYTLKPEISYLKALHFQNSDLANDVERWLQELDELREEKMCMQDKIAEYHTELGTKAVQLDELAKSVW